MTVGTPRVAFANGRARTATPSGAATWDLAQFALVLLAAACGGSDLATPPRSPAPVDQIVVAGAPDTIAVGGTLTLTASARDSSGNPLSDITFAWSSADTTVAVVSQGGVVTGVGPGLTEIAAAADGVVGNLAISVLGSPPPSGSPGLQLVASGLSLPLYLTSPPADPRLFVVEQGGAIRIVKDGAVLPEPFLDLSSLVSTKEEQGLLGLAFPSDYGSSGWFLVHYTDLNGNTRLARYHVSSDPDRADPSSGAEILAVQQPGPSHNGGQIQFGPDGMLYMGLGDGGSHDYGDDGRGQSLEDLLGSVLRIEVSGEGGYRIPPDNPFVATPGARPEIWNYGLRNPWRFSFDRGTGDLFIADVGQSKWEEINRGTVAEGAGRAVNYGWSQMEGTTCVRGDCSGFTPPLVEYSHADGCAVIGGYVYRGTALATLQGQYLYGDFCDGWVRSIPAAGPPGTPTDWPSLSPGRHLTSFGEDAQGELYVMTSEGNVFKIVSR
jgi:glucose/arabinose dehydrogenase